MTKPHCERYLQDPEANASHLEECEECRAFFATLDAPVTYDAVTLSALPMASWEGASHRSWRLVASAAAFVVMIVAGFFALTGVSPRVVEGALPPFDVLFDLPRLAGGFLHNAPGTWRLVIVIAFLCVNTLLYFLLRRAPRGIDA